MTATFTYNTGSAGAYDWSATSNWTAGAVPVSGDSVSVTGDALGDISVDNVASLALASLSVNNYVSGRTFVDGVVDIAAGNTLTVTGAITGSGTIALSGIDTALVAGVTQLGGPAVSFDLNAASVPEDLVLTGALAQGQTVTNGGALQNFYQGDTIDFRGFASIGTVVAGSQLTIVGTLAGGGTAEYVFNTYQKSSLLPPQFASDGVGGTLLEATCFARGTMILSVGGEVPVETLREGDEVIVCRDGISRREPVVWTGRLRIDVSRHARPEAVAPVRFLRGALAENVPHRDLLLSPEHCVLLDGYLVPARCLVNDMTIVRESDLPEVEYYHIETRAHAIILAEGLPAETYLDTGNRAIFENAGTALMLHPEFHINAGLRQWASDACAPLAEDTATIEPIWRRVAERARMQGYVAPARPVTTEADLRLRVGGRSFAPAMLAPDRAVFALPGGLVGDMVLASRHASSADRPAWLNDNRRLGVAVRRIVVRSGPQERVLSMDHPALAGGWHPVEGVGPEAWRWTDGAGRIRLQAGPAAVVVEVSLCGAMTYPLASDPLRSARAA